MEKTQTLFVRNVKKETVYKLRVLAAKGQVSIGQMLDRIVERAK